MKTQLADRTVNGGTATEIATPLVKQVTAKRKPRKTAKSKPLRIPNPERKSKKDQLVALLSKPNGARISVVVERLGWQAHTVRAALSGLRKQGFEIETSKSSKTGETVYSIVARQNGGDGQPNEATS